MRRLPWIQTLAICASMALAQQADFAAAVPPPARPGAPKLDAPVAIAAGLKSDDNLICQDALQAALEMLNDPKRRAAAMGELPDWLAVLLAQKRFEEIEDLALSAICTDPASLASVEKCQEFRIRARLAAGRPKEALSLAKSLYNVCSMRSTSRAIDLISECIFDLNKESDPSGAVRKFKLQQIKGASMGTDGQSQEASILRTTTIDPKAYQDAIAAAKLNPSGFAAIMAEGNLLLLSDRPADAKAIFEKARALATDATIVPATEAVARAIRAEDGVVGRANAWVLALRTDNPEQ